MRRGVVVFAAALAALTACGRQKEAPPAAAPPPGPTYSLACGAAPFDADATAEDIEAVYGAGALTDDLIVDAEGLEEPGAILFQGDPERELRIVWLDPDGRAGLARVETSGTRWSGPSGVKPGATLAEVEAANGGAFEVAGFGWDGAGTVTDWSGGRLAGDDGCRFMARMRPNADAIEAVGDRSFDTDDPAMRAANPSVREIALVYAAPADAAE